jgi:hypothetical protein
LHMCMYVKVKSCQAWHVGPCFRSIEIPANIFSKILHDVCVSSTDRRMMYVCLQQIADRRYFGGQAHFETPIKPGVRNSNNSYRYNAKPTNTTFKPWSFQPLRRLYFVLQLGTQNRRPEDVQFWGVYIYMNATKTKNRFWYCRDRNQSEWQKQIVWATIVDRCILSPIFVIFVCMLHFFISVSCWYLTIGKCAGCSEAYCSQVGAGTVRLPRAKKTEKKRILYKHEMHVDFFFFILQHSNSSFALNRAFKIFDKDNSQSIDKVPEGGKKSTRYISVSFACLFVSMILLDKCLSNDRMSNGQSVFRRFLLFWSCV